MCESQSYADLPVEIEWVDTFGGTGETKASLEAGDLDMAVALTEGMIKAIAAGNPSRILRTFVSTPLQWGVHVPASSELFELSDLEGHRFAISRFGSGSHLMAHVLADDLGFVATKEQFVKVGNLDGARAALANGQAEIFLWDRSSTSPYVENGEFRRVGLQPTPWPSFVVVARDDVIAQHKLAIDAVLDHVAWFAQDLAANPDRISLVSDRYDISEEEVAGWFGETSWDCMAPSEITMIKATQERLVELGLIETPIEPELYLG